jgi:predicted Rossmann fold flavoprotein
VKTNHGLVAAGAVVLASGGKSYPALGATGAGYDLARSVRHTIVAPVPALVGLVTAERWPASLAGVSLSSARVWIDLPKVGKAGRTGDVLFTHGGISGPAVLDLSGEVSQLLTEHKTVPVRLEVVAARPRAAWLAELDRWDHTDGTKLVRLMLGASMPAALVQIVLKQAGVDGETRCAHLARPAREAIAAMLGGMELTVTRTEGFERAIVTRGGVSLKEVDPRTLQSRLVAGLYLAGEVLDLDGACGGYNLQWAFSSGRLAGQSAMSPQRHGEHRE